MPQWVKRTHQCKAEQDLVDYWKHRALSAEGRVRAAQRQLKDKQVHCDNLKHLHPQADSRDAEVKLETKEFNFRQEQDYTGQRMLEQQRKESSRQYEMNLMQAAKFEKERAADREENRQLRGKVAHLTSSMQNSEAKLAIAHEHIDMLKAALAWRSRRGARGFPAVCRSGRDRPGRACVRPSMRRIPCHWFSWRAPDRRHAAPRRRGAAPTTGRSGGRTRPTCCPVPSCPPGSTTTRCSACSPAAARRRSPRGTSSSPPQSTPTTTGRGTRSVRRPRAPAAL
eukprot:TRINITY_DN20251_c0_g1_i1.p1 TRINITY_DN20251_c0_g1~~TRINITY_DN20251_c0_g1_i1.p1  ORF type:complete len:315 (+),score=64.35 TRINITY_DN20251_c0_g1_i1:102-947(+)